MKKRSYFKTEKGSVLFAMAITLILVVFHVDFWNWGYEQNIFFGWITQEFLYRIIFLIVIAPLSSWLIVKFSWPLREEKEEL
ncbi:MAG: hypothetical protein ACOWWR_11520 [Eubacteriales bacterium]